MAAVEGIPLWSEKYRPSTFSEIIGRDSIVPKLKKYVENREFPHILLSGPPGGGKLSLARVFARELLQQGFALNFQELFAGDRLTDEERKEAERGAYISTTRLGSAAGSHFTFQKFLQIRVKPFVEVRAIGNPFKVLAIKDFELLENQQQGFRRLMETYSQNCRMILITTQMSNVLEPILSRCQVIFVPKLDYKDFFKILKMVGDREGLQFGIPVIQALYRGHRGQVGKAIDTLQIAAMKSTIITEDAIYENTRELAPKKVRDMLQSAVRGDVKHMRDILRSLIKNRGMSMQDLLTEIFAEISIQPLPRFAKVEVISLLSDLDHQATYHRVDEVQVSNVLLHLFKYGQGGGSGT